jgi:hypothetical protein
MNEKPLTATMIVEANREYWSRPDVIARGQHLNDVIDASVRRMMDIICGRVRWGWPTREDGGDIC